MNPSPLVGVIMGSQSDWETMRHTAETLTALGVAHETKIVSAHRTPDLLFEYAAGAEGRGLRVIIAGAGGAAHLPGMCASKTVLPVLGVPVESKALSGMDSLLSIVQMPGGIPVGTLAIGKAGAINAALLAAAIIGTTDAGVRERVREFRRQQTEGVLANPVPGGTGVPPVSGALGDPLTRNTGGVPVTPVPGGTGVPPVSGALGDPLTRNTGGTPVPPSRTGGTSMPPPRADKGSA